MDLGLILALRKQIVFVVLLCLLTYGLFRFYLDYYHQYSTALALKWQQVEFTTLWRIPDSWVVCVQTAQGGWVSAIEGTLYSGKAAHDECAGAATAVRAQRMANL